MPRYAVHRGPFLQRGRGIGSVIARIFSRLVPFLGKAGKTVAKAATNKAVKKVAKEALKSGSRSAVKAGANVILNKLEGKDVKEGLKSDLSSAKKDLASTIRHEISPSSQKNRDRKNNKKIKLTHKNANKINKKVVARKKVLNSLI